MINFEIHDNWKPAAEFRQKRRCHLIPERFVQSIRCLIFCPQSLPAQLFLLEEHQISVRAHISMIITFFFTKGKPGRSILPVCFLFCFFVSEFASPGSFTASFPELLEANSNDAFASKSLRRFCWVYFLRCSLHRSQDTRLSPKGIASFRLQYLHWDAWGAVATGCSMFTSGGGWWGSSRIRARILMHKLNWHVIVRQK